MTVKTFIQPDSTTQTATSYPAILDSASSVFTRQGDNFAPHAQATPDLTVALDPGHLMNGQTLVEKTAQNTSAVTPPTTNPRIDRIVVDNVTGNALVVTGVEAVSPSAPAIPAGKSPVAQVMLLPSSVAITNAMLTDERDFSSFGASSGGLIGVQTFNTTATYTPTPGTTKVIVEVQGAGGSGGGSAAAGASAISSASAGGAGAYGKAMLTSGFAGVTVTVGLGGASPAAGANDGADGGSSSFGTLVVAGGGKRGLGSSASTPPFQRGSGGSSAAPTGANIVSAIGAAGMVATALSINSGSGGIGAWSNFGGGGFGGGNGNGQAAVAPGAGGGGACSFAGGVARSGGAGGNGIVIVYEYA